MITIPENKKIRVIIDTDAACEADDPFAIAHALMSPKLIVRALVAEHFAAPGSMKKSREAIRRLLDAMHREANLLDGEECIRGIAYLIDKDGKWEQGVFSKRTLGWSGKSNDIWGGYEFVQKRKAVRR